MIDRRPVLFSNSRLLLVSCWCVWFLASNSNSNSNSRQSSRYIPIPSVEAWVLPPTTIAKAARRHASKISTSTSTSTCHKVIFTRLSEDCMSVLSAAQEEAQTLKQSQVDNPCVLVGLCHHPGRAGPTLEEFKITAPKLQETLQYLQPKANSFSSSSRTPKLSDFSVQEEAPELPLAAALQQTLFEAGKISSTMGATSIDPEHLLLALLNYQEVNGEPQAATRSDDCEAMELIYHLDATLEGEDICFSLLQSLMKQTAEVEREQNTKSNESKEEHQHQHQHQQQHQQPSTSASSKSTSATSTSSPTSATSGAATAVAGTGAAMSEAKEKARSLLQECGVDLTQLAREGSLDMVAGRDDEMRACFQTMVRRRKNNVCLIGEAGVGKTCIVEGLAQILISDQCPPFLEGHRIISLEVGALLAGTKFRGEFEERLRTIIEILSNSRTKSILFLDEIHNLVGAGGNSEGNMDASNILKPYLARGQLQVIGATTITEYNRYIAKDAALERRFQPVLIREPTVDETVHILETVMPFYRQHHRVDYTPGSLDAAARLSDRYINDRFLPDKAIDVLDEAGAMATLSRNRMDLEPPEVTEKSITDIISRWTNIPVGKLEMDEMDRLQLLEENLARRVKGQERAVRTVSKAIRRARTGIRNPRRPIASFLFCGPTGTGKTELCKALADTYFGSERNLIRIDMSEYMEKSAVSRLTGPPPGLVGYEEGGQLTEAVRRSPHSVVLLDELEKAHGDVLNVLLQVLEDGILTDGKGRTISFKNTVLIMTSNIGSKRILDLVQKHERKHGVAQAKRKSNGASNDDTISDRIPYSKLARVVKGELEKALKPEFLNRIDDIVVFQPLTPNELSLIALMMVVDITARAKMEKDIDVTVSKELLERMVVEGSAAASQFGARPMRRAIQRILEDAISDAVVKSFLVEGDAATFGSKGVDDETGQLIVAVSRSRDATVLDIPVENSNRDLVSEVFDDDDDYGKEDSEGEGDLKDMDENASENEYIILETPPL